MALTARLNNHPGAVDDADYAKRHGVRLLSGDEEVFAISWKEPDPFIHGQYRKAAAWEPGIFVVFPIRRIRAALRAKGITYPPDAVDVWAASETLQSAIELAEKLMSDAT